MWHKALGRKSRLAQVPPRQPRAARVELAHRADRHGLHRPVENVDFRIPDGPTDRHGSGGFRRRLVERVAAGKGGVLRRAIAVDEPDAGQRAHRAPHVRDRERLAADQQLVESVERLRVIVNHRVEERRGEPHRGHAPAFYRAAQRLRRRHALGEENAAPTVQQRAPQLEGRGVKGDGRGVQQRASRVEARVVDAEEQACDAAVRDGDALRSAGRAGGVDDVGQVVRRKGRDEVRPALPPYLCGLRVQKNRPRSMVWECVEQVLLS